MMVVMKSNSGDDFLDLDLDVDAHDSFFFAIIIMITVNSCHHYSHHNLSLSIITLLSLLYHHIFYHYYQDHSQPIFRLAMMIHIRLLRLLRASAGWRAFSLPRRRSTFCSCRCHMRSLRSDFPFSRCLLGTRSHQNPIEIYVRTVGMRFRFVSGRIDFGIIFFGSKSEQVFLFRWYGFGMIWGNVVTKCDEANEDCNSSLGNYDFSNHRCTLFPDPNVLLQKIHFARGDLIDFISEPSRPWSISRFGRWPLLGPEWLISWSMKTSIRRFALDPHTGESRIVQIFG